MVDEPSKEARSFAVEIRPASRIPQPKLRARVNEAIAEAGAHFREQHNLALEVSGTADGGLFDLGAAWPWVIHFGGSVVGGLLYKAGEEAAKEAGKEVGKEAGKSFYELLKESLRKRNLTVSRPNDLRLFPDPNNPYASLAPVPPKAKKKPRKRKAPVKKTKAKTKKKGKGSKAKRNRR
jgi:hypothetical protein